MRKWQMIAATPLLLGSAAGDGGYRVETVAGWRLEAFDADQDPENPSPPYIYEMSLMTAGLHLDYEIKAGQERELGVQRLNCGTATDANGGVNFVDSIYLSGDRAKDIAAITALAKSLDASFDDYCKVPADQLSGALKTFSVAAERLESWSAARPIPLHWAWHLDYLYEPSGRTIARRNHAYSVRYDIAGDLAEAGFLTVDAIDCPASEGFVEPFTASIDRSKAAGNHAARVRAELERGVMALAASCGLDPAAGRALGGGIEGAIARGESEARKDAGGA